MSGYARPESLEEALALLARPEATPLAGGTDLLGQIDRQIVSPDLLVDLQDTGLDTLHPDGKGVTVGAGVRIADLAESDFLAPYTAVTQAASQLASPLLRNAATLGGNLCQGTRCWYYRGHEWRCWLGGGDTCYAQIGDHRKHNLQPGDCISAHPSDLAPALAACGASIHVVSNRGDYQLPLLELYRRPTTENRSLLVLAPDEIIASVTLPNPPDASTYIRIGERRAFSFPLISIAAARQGSETRMVAAGVANTPWEIKPDDPLADLPGHPQSLWKREILTAIVGRAHTAVAA